MSYGQKIIDATNSLASPIWSVKRSDTGRHGIVDFPRSIENAVIASTRRSDGPLGQIARLSGLRAS